jgi:hypothetical protein
MTAPVKVEENYTLQECFAYGLARVDNIGSCSRLTFYVLKRDHEGKPVNEATMVLTVPTDQIATMVVMLSSPSSENIEKAARAFRDEKSESTMH